MQQQVSTVGVGNDQCILSPEVSFQVMCNSFNLHVKVELLKLPNRLTPHNIKAPFPQALAPTHWLYAHRDQAKGKWFESY